MRVPFLLSIVIVTAGCSSGGLFPEPAASDSLVGGITGTIVMDDGVTPATGASVSLATQSSDGAYDRYDTAASFVNAAGRFRVDAVPGRYTLLASVPGYALVADVDVLDGVLSELGTLVLDPCGTGTAVDPCPSADASPSPPPEAFSLASFTPDYTIAVRDTGANYDSLFIRAENYAQGIWIEVSIDDPNAIGAGTHSVGGAGPIDAALYYVTDGGAYYYVAASGSLQVTTWSPTPGGQVSVSLSGAVFEHYDTASGTLESGNGVTVESTDALAATVESPNG